MTGAIPSDIKQFWEKQGYCNFRKIGMYEHFIVADKNNTNTIMGFYNEINDIFYYYLAEGGDVYSEDEIRKIIKLKAFL